MEEMKKYLVVVLTAVFAACSGPSNVTQPPDMPEEDAPSFDISDFETFDATAYRDDPPSVPVQVDHDVPEALMQSRADAGISQVVDGFRVQVFSSLDPDEAVQAEEDVKAWYEELPQSTRSRYGIASRLPVYNNYKQPLYRVRVGDFTNRTQAERLMSLMSSRFANVFVVPDRITITR